MTDQLLAYWYFHLPNYLLAVLGGSVVSSFASQTSSGGASGGVLGLAG